MDSLLYTFNKKQLSQDITTIKNNEDKLSDFLLSYQQKREMKLRTFRSKKLRRYEQCIQDVHLNDCSFNPAKQDGNYRRKKIYIDDDPDLIIKPHSSKHIQTCLRPKVSKNNRQFPSDFICKQAQKPQSMQLIRQELRSEQQFSFKRKIRNDIQTETKKRLSTSKDAPKIHFPVSDKKLPQVFRFRSISHDRVNPSSGRRPINLANSIERLHEMQSPQKNMSKRQMYLKFTKAAEGLCDTEPTKGKTIVRRKKIESFYLNAEETPHFKKTIN